MTNYEYLIQDEYTVAKFIGKIGRDGVCKACFRDVCYKFDNCDEGHYSWLVGEYDKNFWEEVDE